ncbi:MAG: hypothetical protein SV966_15640 [Actinomycetota bacterium]|nr:hypothetical protein [Actinomycetota bacterium]
MDRCACARIRGFWRHGPTAGPGQPSHRRVAGRPVRTGAEPGFASLAEHYGTAIIPARVKRPRDKPVVEGSVRFVANQVAAVLRDRRFVGLAELNEALFDVVDQINAFKSRATGPMRRGCTRHTRGTLQPTLVISQGKGELEKSLEANLGVTEWKSPDIAMCDLDGNRFIWVSLRHPSRGNWHSLKCAYVHDAWSQPPLRDGSWRSADCDASNS